MDKDKTVTVLAAALLGLQLSVSAAVGTVNTETLNIRSEANTYSNIVGQAGSGQQLDIIGRSGDFYEIYYNGASAYVHGDYVVPEIIANGVVTASLLNIRTGAGTNFGVMGQLAKGDGVAIFDVYGDWYQIKIAEKFGYVHSSYISVPTSITSRSSAPASRSGSTVSRKGTAIVEYSKQFLGTPYVSGGSSPSGFDCSGFTYYVFKQYGVTLPRTSSSQANAGHYVAKSELKPGDLVFFDTYGGISHVGIYVGNDSFIHSTVPGDVVKISSLSTAYYKSRYVTARRIFD